MTHYGPCPACGSEGTGPTHAPDCPVGTIAEAGKHLQAIRQAWQNTFGMEPRIQVNIHLELARTELEEPRLAEPGRLEGEEPLWAPDEAEALLEDPDGE
jgi:hypothetical protein